MAGTDSSSSGGRAAGSEVDFVVYGKVGFWAIEVKSTGRVRPEDLRPLAAFAEEYPEAVPILLYRGVERLRIGKIWCLPVETFLRDLRPGRPLPVAGTPGGGKAGKQGHGRGR